MKLIFLDIDGVLNGYGPLIYKIAAIMDKLHLTKFFNRYYDIFGVRTYKVYLLHKIVKATGAKIVLSSSWRNGWKVPYKNCGRRMKSLKRKFKFFGICVIGVTGHSDTGNREDELRECLKLYDDIGIEVERFVILDDESFDLKGFIGKELIKTSQAKDMIRGLPEEHTGLKAQHVKEAIAILNR